MNINTKATRNRWAWTQFLVLIFFIWLQGCAWMTSSQSETRSPSLRSVTFAETVILDQTEILAHTDPSVPTLCQWSVMSENAQSGSSVVVSEWGDCKLSISTKNGFTSEDQIRIRLNLCPSERVVSSHCTQIIPTEWERVARVMKR